MTTDKLTLQDTFLKYYFSMFLIINETIWSKTDVKRYDELICVCQVTYPEEHKKILLHQALPFIKLKHPLILINSRMIKPA